MGWAGPAQSPASKSHTFSVEENSWLTERRSGGVGGLGAGPSPALVHRHSSPPAASSAHCTVIAGPGGSQGHTCLASSITAGFLNDSGRPREPLCYPRLPNPNPPNFSCPFLSRRRLRRPRIQGLTREGSSLREQDCAALLPCREAKVLGPGGLSRARGFLRAQNGVRMGAGAGSGKAKGRVRCGGLC